LRYIGFLLQPLSPSRAERKSFLLRRASGGERHHHENDPEQRGEHQRQHPRKAATFRSGSAEPNPSRMVIAATNRRVTRCGPRLAGATAFREIHNKALYFLFQSFTLLTATIFRRSLSR
jgi:hypothetical protein